MGFGFFFDVFFYPLDVALAEAIRIICPNPPRDRFEKVAPLGNRLFFSQTEDRKKFCRWRSWEAIKSNQVFQTPLVVIDCAPGDGKTHFEWVLANRKHDGGVLDQELERALEKFQEPDGASAKDLILGAELKASFDPELTINPRNVFADRSRKAIGVSVTFNHDTLPSGESGHSMIAVRMLYSHFCRGDFGWFVNELEQHGFPNVDEQTAFDLIRADIDRAFPNENRAVILVVDEVVMSGKDEAVITSLHTLALKDSNDIHIIASIISPKRSQYLESCGRTPLIQISFPPLSGAAVAKLVNSLPEKERTLLQLDSFQSLLRDCAGIPRFVEFVCKIACRVAACPGLERGFDDRRVLLAELRNDSNAPFVKFLAERRWNDFCLSTVFAFGSEFVVSDLGVAKRDFLFTEGFLHPLSCPDPKGFGSGPRSYGVAPLLFELNAARGP